MKKTILAAVSIFALGMAAGNLTIKQGIANNEPPVNVDSVLRADLEVAEGIEVIVSVIDIGPNFSLPKHYHPGEEFVYILEGSASLWQQGKPDTILNAGDAVKIPLEQPHTATTNEEPVRAVVFRVHRKGEPERIPVE